ncbi:hypothetical protein Avbf_07412 [Armadillidium vulgare]|nr:hypothetical protein Avbf_07412 [Armadillidium vulgare]
MMNRFIFVFVFVFVFSLFFISLSLGSPKPDPVVVAEHMSSHILDDFEAVLDKLLKKRRANLGRQGFFDYSVQLQLSMHQSSQMLGRDLCYQGIDSTRII